MIELRCGKCRLVWREDRGKDDSPTSPHAFACPRCGWLGEKRFGSGVSQWPQALGEKR